MRYDLVILRIGLLNDYGVLPLAVDKRNPKCRSMSRASSVTGWRLLDPMPASRSQLKIIKLPADLPPAGLRLRRSQRYANACNIITELALRKIS